MPTGPQTACTVPFSCDGLCVTWADDIVESVEDSFLQMLTFPAHTREALGLNLLSQSRTLGWR